MTKFAKPLKVTVLNFYIYYLPFYSSWWRLLFKMWPFLYSSFFYEVLSNLKGLNETMLFNRNLEIVLTVWRHCGWLLIYFVHVRVTEWNCH